MAKSYHMLLRHLTNTTGFPLPSLFSPQKKSGAASVPDHQAPQLAQTTSQYPQDGFCCLHYSCQGKENQKKIK